MLRRIVVIAVLVCLPATVWALELKTPVTDSLSIVETLKAQYDITDEDNPYWALINRLNLVVAKGPFMAGVRYDAEAYFLDEEYYARYIPEKAFFQYQEDGILLRLGDSYVQFGHGLTVSLLKRDEFGEDTTVQGGLFKLEQDYFEFETFIGPVNPGDDRRFGPERAQVEEPEFFSERDQLWGARLVGGAPGIVRGGGSWVGGTLRTDPDSPLAEFEEDDMINLYSLLIEAPDLAGVGAIDGEYAWLEYEDVRTERLGDLEYEGRGAHLSSTWYLGPVTLLAEGIDYFRFGYPHNDPPTMEFPEMAFGHLPNYDDAIGGRARLDYTIPVLELGVYGNYTNIQTHEETSEQLTDHYSADASPWLEWIEHAYGGFDRTFGYGTYLAGVGGYREAPEGRFVHGQLRVDTPVVAPHSVNAEGAVKQFHSYDENSYADAVSYETSLGYGYAPYFAITGCYEWSDEPAGGVLELGAQAEEDPHFWSVDAVIKPADWSRITLAYGRYKGGIKCAGGVCRQVPPFEGLKTEFAFLF